ncbi:hypothetical protein AUI06_12790 [archaeon 13_2_20CM_2_52_21]|nr:MAG: hypothetical protein AUI06_12790 [archaeon 13_2_20CM_2_52_21]OLD08254.1 MAG: hypothetical protein AUI95_03645 [Crenarchaeota archaeon 13_1_40CM_3_52_4]OLD44357.1 MAG: hypothetical protein AUI51_02710 [archaeon 13_1_40CM_2_52_4]
MPHALTFLARASGRRLHPVRRSARLGKGGDRTSRPRHRLPGEIYQEFMYAQNVEASISSRISTKGRLSVRTVGSYFLRT